MRLSRLGAVLVLLLQSAVTHAEIVDRVAAVVNDRVITLSDVEWSFLDTRSGLPADPHARQEALAARLDRLVEQELIAQEAEKEPLFALDDSDVENELKKLEGRYGGRKQLEAAARRSGLSLERLRPLLRRQISVLKFVETRLRPFILVSAEEIAAYYRETLIAELQKQGIPDAPPLESVRAQIDRLLAEQKLDKELEKWVAAARKRARIIILLNREESPNKPPQRWLEE
ncbi:MAG: hypothetical protein HYX74_06645 [Acidobacteria bacterium]|nr:hypothetical protein [Acidobacteriota bacterium]